MEFLDDFYSSLDKLSDERSRNYLLLQGVSPLCVILTAYLAFCCSLGPRLMKPRPAFQFKNFIILYNLLNVIGSVWLLYEIILSGWFNRFGFSCEPVKANSSTSSDLRIARVQWAYFMMKIFELLDTVFFVLRKKDNQVTLLHLYHHTSTPILAWSVAKFIPVGRYTFDVFLNTSVHVIMYSYYLFSSLGPQYQKYLWWKKYLTAVQIIQLVMVIAHHVQILFLGCDHPKAMSAAIVLSTAFNLYQFVLFFRRSYSKDRKVK